MDIVTYSIQGWADKNTWASFYKENYKTYNGVLRAFEHYKKTGKFQALTIREEVECADTYISISTPIKKWEV